MAAPTISSCSPGSGPKAGGTPVHIVGTEFTGATAVTFDGTNATMYSVVNATNILAVAPAGSGIGDVVVTTAAGSGTLEDGFSYEGTLCTNDDIKKKAGTNVSATSIAEAYTTAYTLQAESYLMALCNYDWVANYASTNANIKGLLREATSNLGAIYAIGFDMSSFTTRIEAEDMINILYARFIQCVELLKDSRTVEYLKNVEV